MLKRIEAPDVELGMYIHGLEGSWLKHPFWRARFVLSNHRELDKLRSSDVSGVIIDTAKGRDLVGLAEHAEAAPEIAPTEDTGPKPGTRRLRTARRTAPPVVEREFGQAMRAVDRSGKVISGVFLKARLGKRFKPALVEPVLNDIFAQVESNVHAFNGLMRCKHDLDYVYRHALATSALMITLGRELKLPPDQLKLAGMAGLLLDIGIGRLPLDFAAVHGDYRRLPEEQVREHSRLGHDFLVAVGVAEPVALASLEHHECIDGSGTPRGLRGGDISLLGRMAAICDGYDELVNDADGAPGLNPAAAIERLTGQAGHFDSALLRAFTRAMGIYPVGSLVVLRSGRLAMVVDQCPGDPALPTVIAFQSLLTGHRTPPVAIALADCGDRDSIESAVEPEAFGIVDFASLRQKLFEIS